MSYLFTPNTNILNSNSDPITNTEPLPVTLGSNTITINGNVNVGPTVNIGALLSTANVTVQGNVAGITANVIVQGSLQVNNFLSNVSITSGNVAIFGTSNVTFSNQSVNVTNFPATQNVQVLSNSTNYVTMTMAPTWQTDALSRIRTSIVQGQNWYVPTVDDDTLYIWSQALNGTNSNSQFLANTSEISISSGNTAGGYAYRQTRIKYKVVPGDSQTVFTTINFNANSTETGVTRRSGLFDTKNGAFWEQTANTLNIVVRRTLANGTIQEDRINSANFNTDKLDGTGPSGFNIFALGLNKYYTFWFDMIGGRTGRMRFGLGTAQGPQIAHTQGYAGQLATPFFNSGSLPLRREIYNNTAQVTSPTFNMTAIAYQNEAPIAYTPSPATAYNVAGFVPGSSLAPIITIGVRSGFPFTQINILPKLLSLLDQNNQGNRNGTFAGNFLYTMHLNANVNGTYAYSGNAALTNANTGRASQYWTWANTATISGGLLLASGIFNSTAQENFGSLPDAFAMGSDINDNPSTLTISVQQLLAGGGAANIIATVNFTEQM